MAGFGGSGPIDYWATFQGAPTFGQAFDAGRAEAEKQRQLQAQQEAAAAMQADLQAASQNPSLLPGVMVRYPQLAEKLKHGWDAMSAEQQRVELDQTAQVYSALRSNRPDLAAKLLRDRGSAYSNAGDSQRADAAERLAQLAEQFPEQAAQMASFRLAALPGGDKVIESIGKLGVESRAAAEAPYELKKKQADATTAEAKAKYAESDVLLDLEKKGWDIKKVQADIQADRERNRIAAMNAAISRETNDLKRQELQLRVQEARSALDEKIRGRVAEAESGAASIDNMLNTIERVKRSKDLGDVTGSIEGRMPAFLDSGNADAIALIETLGSQAFVAQIPSIKGTGALSDAEGKKLQSALQSLDRTQSEEQFRANLDEAARLLTKARQNLSKRTGVPLAKPDTPAAPGSRPPLSSFGGG